MLNLTQHSDAVWIPLRVQPRASRDEVVEVLSTGALKVRIKAPPVDGAANAHLLKWLAKKVLNVSPRQVSLVRGHTGRDKVVAVEGLSLADVLERLGV